MDTDSAAPSFGVKLSRLLNKTEQMYLRVLRGMVLLLATLLIGYAAWLAATALYKVSRSPNSVTEKVAQVTPDELAAADVFRTSVKESGDLIEPAATSGQRRQYASFVDAYFKLYRSRFEGFKRNEDKSLSRDEFDGAFIQSSDRLTRVANGKLDADQDLRDLSTLLGTMEAAALRPATVQRLQRYKKATKVQVCNNFDRTRTEYRRGWDRYSTTCSNWFEDPIGCAVMRPVEVAYQQRVCSMQMPRGVVSHTQTFRAFQDRFFELLSMRRQQFAGQASAEREAIILGIEDGKAKFG